jgi:5-oxoprolinase (ATP-hydrolysing) subunit C
MSLLILDPGLDSRIVDLGRPRSRSLGVPVGGAADRRSFLLGNALIGNTPDAAALEFALKGPRLRAESDVGCVIFGAPFNAFRGDQRVEVGKSFTLRAGDDLRIGGTTIGARAYLCVRRGFDAPMILASRSGLDNLRGGELLACAPSQIRGRYCPAIEARSLEEPSPIIVIPGPQASWFDEEEFYEQEFTVAPASNRMGLRLSGVPLSAPRREMTSEPVAPGAVQVSNDGQCIILGADGQTIGGYPKIAHVIQANLDAISQSRPGSKIRFKRFSLEEAIARDRAVEAELREWTLRLRLSLEAFPAY